MVIPDGNRTSRVSEEGGEHPADVRRGCPVSVGDVRRGCPVSPDLACPRSLEAVDARLGGRGDAPEGDRTSPTDIPDGDQTTPTDIPDGDRTSPTDIPDGDRTSPTDRVSEEEGEDPAVSNPAACRMADGVISPEALGCGGGGDAEADVPEADWISPMDCVSGEEGEDFAVHGRSTTVATALSPTSSPAEDLSPSSSPAALGCGGGVAAPSSTLSTLPEEGNRASIDSAEGK
jgi:hypothetical protein